MIWEEEGDDGPTNIITELRLSDHMIYMVERQKSAVAELSKLNVFNDS